MPKQKKKKQNRPALITVELTAIVLIAVYLTGYMVSAVTKPTVATEVVSYGQIDSPREFRGIIAREEIVTYAHDDGTAFYNFVENEYVKKGSLVCVTKKTNDADLLEKQINMLSDDILQKQELRNDAAVYMDEVKRINSRIRMEIDNKAPYFHTFTGDDIYKLKYQLQKDIDSRNTIRISNGSEALDGLNDRKDAYERRLMDGSQTYEAVTGGIISYVVDGFEEEITPETVFELSKSQVTHETEDSIKNAGDRQVEKGEPIFKIVSSNIWYIGAYFENSVIRDWNEGSNRSLYVKDGRTTRKITLKISKITPMGNESYVVFSTTKYLSDFLNMRGIDFYLDDDSFKGLKVPNTAITEKTALIIPKEFIYDFRGIRGVYVSNGADYTFKGVTELSYDGDNAYVLQDFGSVQIGTVLYSKSDKTNAIGEKNFTINDITGTYGVYVANSGTAEFKQINVLAKNDFYSVIQKNSQYGVKPYDRIITDASTVDNNTILRK